MVSANRLVFPWSIVCVCSALTSGPLPLTSTSHPNQTHTHLDLPPSSCYVVEQMKKGERDLKMRDDPGVPSLENRNSEFDLADIEKNLENRCSL